MASDFPKGVMFVVGVPCLLLFVEILEVLWKDVLVGTDNWDWTYALLLFALVLLAAMTVFAWRLDLRIPKDRPIRFNRRQGKVYINHYEWNHNPFGRWSGGVKVLDWNTLQAVITYQVGASGEVLTQRYALNFVTCKPGAEPGTFEAVDAFRFEHGAQTTVQYEEIWALLRHYMVHGTQGLPRQNLRDTSPGFIDCLLFGVPWLAPTAQGHQARARIRGFWPLVMAVLMTLLLPLWLLFGVGHFVAMRLAPEAVWPDDTDVVSRSAAHK